MSGLEYTLESNSYDKKHRGITVAKTYLWAGRNRVAPPRNIYLGAGVPNLQEGPAHAVSLVQNQLDEDSRQNILAIAFLRETHRAPEVRLGRIGGIVIATMNRFTLPVINPLPSQIDSNGIASVRLRDPESTPEAPRLLPASAELRPVIVLPVFSTPRERHPVTDVIAVGHSVFAGLHGDMEIVVDKSVLG